MYKQINKPKENSFPTNRQESRAVANSVNQKKSNGKQGFGFVDNRHEAYTQRKLQAMTNDSHNASVTEVIQRAIRRRGNLRASGNVTLTNDSTSGVAGIGQDIMNAQQMIADVPNLVVYAGYHGDATGQFAGAFNQLELAQVDQIARNFPNIQALHKPNQGLTDQDMKDNIAAGNTFFTWCYSDRRIPNLL